MSGVETASDPKRHLASAAEVALLLRRALDARQLYVPGHPSTKGLIASLHARLGAHLAEFGALELAVTSLALLVGEKPVLEAERREESISHPLFLDGVRSLTLQPRLPLDELSTLLELWYASVRPPEDDGQTFPTRFWEAGLQFVNVATVDALVDGAAEAAEIDALMEQLQAGRLPFRSVPAGALATSLGNSRASFEADIGARLPEAVHLDASPLAYTREEVQRLLAELDGQRPTEAERALVALLQLAAASNPSSWTQFDRAVHGIFGALARSNQFAEIAKIARNIAQARRAQQGSFAELLTRILRQLGSPEVVSLALAALPSPELGESAATALSFLPGNAAGALLDALTQTTDPVVRERLSAVITALLPNGALLETRVATADAESAQLLLKLALALPLSERMRVHLKGLAHEAAPVRLAALEGLKTGEGLTNAATIRPLLSDPDVRVRRSALNLLVRAKDRETVVTLAAHLKQPSLDEAERKTIYNALGTLGGEAAGRALRAEFTARKEPELRSTCALALARAGDEAARPLLEATIKKLLFTPAAVKDACREALRRLDARKSAPPSAEELT